MDLLMEMMLHVMALMFFALGIQYGNLFTKIIYKDISREEIIREKNEFEKCILKEMNE